MGSCLGFDLAFRSHAGVILAAVVAVSSYEAITPLLVAQAPVTPSQITEPAATLKKATLLRDTFIQRIHSAGFTCPIAAPTILVEDVPSFGQYEDSTNTLRTSDWSLLRPEERAFFLKLAGPGADEPAAHAVFEKAAHE